MTEIFILNNCLQSLLHKFPCNLDMFLTFADRIEQGGMLRLGDRFGGFAHRLAHRLLGPLIGDPDDLDHFDGPLPM